MIKLLPLLEESITYEYGCVMAPIKIKNWKNIINLIDKEDIYDNDEHEYGMEEYPHCTILYGIHMTNTVHKDIKEILKNKHPIILTIENVNVFKMENKPYNVLKFGVSSDGLIELNKEIRAAVEYTNEFDYTPHITIGYIKKNVEIKKYKDILEKSLPKQYVCKQIEFNGKTEEDKTTYTLQ